MRSKSGVTVSALVLTLSGAAFSAGCHEPASSPPRVEVPQRPGEGMRYERDDVKPLPRQGQASDVGPAPFDDVPLVTQNTPEQKAYVRAYNDVGRPRIVVAVNRGVTPAKVEVSGGNNNNRDAGGVGVRSIDTEAIDNILTDWLAADGQVEILSPLAQAASGQPALSDKQKTDLHAGQGNAVAKDVGADVLVQVSSRLTEQAGQDLQLRMVAEAVNVGDGRSIGRAVVDVPAPLDKPKINKYTRFMARKLMDGMILTWQSMGKNAPPAAALPQGQLPPAQPPAVQPQSLPKIEVNGPDGATSVTTERPANVKRRDPHTVNPRPMPAESKPAPGSIPPPPANPDKKTVADDTVVVPRE